ncbi:HNH/ENDO VII family nuclease, partial [Helicobacter kayseriensis]|uniref:HNH/ENDO VII family nuclease n=1 Tax=Helicobacter kayseriensis TaxID=2905877 RepID=UPI001E61D5EF
LYHLRDKDALPIDQARGFQILKDANGEDLQGEEIKLSCPLEWKDRQVLLFGYLNAPSLKHSILLLPSSIQEEDEEIIITSLESKHDEEYIKFTFPANPTPPAEEVMQCDEFMIDDAVCELKALSLQESKESQDQSTKQENLKKYIIRFSKELSQKGRREVEFDKELDDFFIYASRNAKSTSSKINQNKSKAEEALLEDGTKITRSKAYREFNKIEQGFLDSAVLVQVEGRSVAQRTQVIDLGAVSLANMKSGKAPRGIDGEPIELHHLQQKEDGILLELTKTEHKDNSRALHSYKKTSEIDRIGFARFKKRYWKARFDGLGI